MSLTPKLLRQVGICCDGSGVQRQLTKQPVRIAVCSAADYHGIADEELAAAAAREGSDGPAFVELVRRHRDRVWRVCYRLMGNEHDAADAAQEVFVRLFVNRAKFAGRSKYSTWLHGVALRTCLTLRRGRGRRLKRVATASDPEIINRRPDRAGHGEATALDLAAMLDTLPEEDRAMLILKYAEGHSYEELADAFELSVSACKMRVSRAREKLKKRFPNEGPE